MDQEVRSYKGPPSLAITEHWNYEDKGKDFFGGYCYMSQGPLPQLWANTLIERPRPLGSRLIEAMKDYNHVVGLKIVGEMLPQEPNRVTLADEVDQYGLRIPRVTYSWCDNDKRLIDHSLDFMTPGAGGGRRHGHLGPRTTTPAISTAPRAWATIRGPASSMRTAAAGTFRTCGSATARCSRPSAASIRR